LWAAKGVEENDLKETRFVFDVELTLLLLKNGFRTREVPINWKEVPGSKVSVLKNSIHMLSGILRIRNRWGPAQPELTPGELSR
jgi:dolichyl-phosphate beta-glucosyltransferase